MHAAYVASITENLSTLDSLFGKSKDNKFTNLCSYTYLITSTEPQPIPNEVILTSPNNNYLDSDGTTEVDYQELVDDLSSTAADYVPPQPIIMANNYATIHMVEDYMGSFRLLTTFAANINPINYGIGLPPNHITAGGTHFCESFYKLQKEFTEAIMDKIELNELNLIKQKSPEDSARIISVADNKAGAFLRVVAKTKTTAMTKMEFRHVIYFRLGCNVPGITSSTTCPHCNKHPLIGLQGQHFHNCPSVNERIQRHNTLVNIIKQLGQMAGYFVSTEPHGCFPLDETEKRPDGLVMNYTQTNQHCAYDVSVTHPANDTSIFQNKSDKVTGAAAKAREIAKKSKYDTLCNKHNLYFVPIVLETYGRWGKLGETLIEDLMQKITQIELPQS
jgi:hypothetical protein